MGTKKIQDFSFGYEFLRRIYFRWFFNHIYYRKVIVRGFENLPKDRPVIIAPNHQNALMDALTLVSKLKLQPVFLARQDVFSGGIISKLLTWVKIMPIYRMRDGIESLGKNDEIFNRSVDVLHDKKQLCLMAEGNHGNRRHLRPLVKGMFRIALKAQELYKEQQGVCIVPLGIEYSHYYKFRQTLIINFGKPIEVSDYYTTYVTEPAKALNQLRERLAQEMSEVMLDIRNEQDYDTIYFLQQIYPAARKNKKLKTKEECYQKFEESKQLVKKLDSLSISQVDKFSELKNLTQQYQEGLKKLKLRDWLFYKSNYSLPSLAFEGLIYLVLLPVFIFGFVHNIGLYLLPQKAVKKIKDLQFHSSVIFALSWLLTPFYFLILFFIAWLISANAMCAFIYTTLAFLCGVPAFEYYLGIRKWLGKIRFRKYMKNQASEIHQLTRIRQGIMELLQTL